MKTERIFIIALVISNALTAWAVWYFFVAKPPPNHQTWSQVITSPLITSRTPKP
jgi:hypothetical protein